MLHARAIHPTGLRVSIRLVDLSPAANLCQHTEFSCTSPLEALRRAALAEAQRVLRNTDASEDIWLHSFHFGGQEYVLSTYYQPARTIAGGRAAATLPPKLIIEVSTAPSGLTTRRTLTRPRRTNGHVLRKGGKENEDGPQ